LLQNQYTTTMRHLKYLAFVACLGSLSPAFAQNASKSLTIDDLVTWQRITDREISDNGKWVACKMEPWEGDATVYLYAAQGQETATFSPADKFRFLGLSGCHANTRKVYGRFPESIEDERGQDADEHLGNLFRRR